MTDDIRLDRDMQTLLEQLPEEQLPAARVTPWRQAMRCVLWGIGLTSITLNFWNLQHLLPMVGSILLMLGCVGYLVEIFGGDAAAAVAPLAQAVLVSVGIGDGCGEPPGPTATASPAYGVSGNPHALSGRAAARRSAADPRRIVAAELRRRVVMTPILGIS